MRYFVFICFAASFIVYLSIDIVNIIQREEAVITDYDISSIQIESIIPDITEAETGKKSDIPRLRHSIACKDLLFDENNNLIYIHGRKQKFYKYDSEKWSLFYPEIKKMGMVFTKISDKNFYDTHRALSKKNGELLILCKDIEGAYVSNYDGSRWRELDNFKLPSDCIDFTETDGGLVLSRSESGLKQAYIISGSNSIKEFNQDYRFLAFAGNIFQEEVYALAEKSGDRKLLKLNSAESGWIELNNYSSDDIIDICLMNDGSLCALLNNGIVSVFDFKNSEKVTTKIKESFKEKSQIFTDKNSTMFIRNGEDSTLYAFKYNESYSIDRIKKLDLKIPDVDRNLRYDKLGNGYIIAGEKGAFKIGYKL